MTFSRLSFSLFWALPFLIQFLRGLASVPRFFHRVCVPVLSSAHVLLKAGLSVQPQGSCTLVLIIVLYSTVSTEIFSWSCALSHVKVLFSSVQSLACSSRYFVFLYPLAICPSWSWQAVLSLVYKSYDHTIRTHHLSHCLYTQHCHLRFLIAGKFCRRPSSPSVGMNTCLLKTHRPSICWFMFMSLRFPSSLPRLQS